MNNEINLLHVSPKKKNALLGRLAALRITSLSFLFIVSFVSIIIFSLIALSPLPSLQQREKDDARTLSFFKQKIVKILLTKERINHINTILRTRPVFAETFDHVAAQVPGRLKIDGVKLEGKKISVTISGDSLDGLDQFTTNIMHLNAKEKRFKRIMLTGILLNADDGRYVLRMELDQV